MQMWLKLLLFSTLAVCCYAAALAQKCPVNCNCEEAQTAVCTTLDIEPFPTEITTLILKDPSSPLEITGEVFTTLGLTKLHNLKIDNAIIKKLNASAFKQIPIEQVVIRHSSIPKVDKALFKESRYIQQIDLSYSQIEKFEGIESAFAQEVVMAGCGLKSISRDAFSNLPALTLLNLENNNLGDFDISGISSDEINLSGNKIKEFFIQSSDVTSLKLNNNPLTTIEIGEKSDLDIEELQLQGCHLDNLDFLRAFSQLSKLYVSDNNIEALPAYIGNNQMTALDLSGNRLKTLTGDFSSLGELTSLKLDRNDLGILPVFKIQSGLDLFSCNDCNLHKLDPMTFEMMHNTKQIFLANNHLENIPEDVFQGVKSLVKIDLSNNSLTSIPENLFAKNTDLSTVILRSNPIKSIDTTLFKNNRMIHTLDITDCQLQHLWANTKNNLESLKELHAGNNSIDSITVDELKVVSNLMVLSVKNNTFLCNTETAKMVDWLQSNGIGFVHESTCDWPVPSDDEYFDNDDEDDLKQKDIDEKNDEYDDEMNSDTIDNSEDADEEDDDDEEDLDDDVPKTKQQEKEQFLQDVRIVNDFEFKRFNSHRASKEMLFFLLPTLVFVLTALVVLLLTVSVILCVLQKRNGRRTNAPQINIMPWSTGNKIKKHSGSIYRPLSEEIIPA